MDVLPPGAHIDRNDEIRLTCLLNVISLSPGTVLQSENNWDK